MKVECIEFKEFLIRDSGEGFTSAATVAVLPEAEEVDLKLMTLI